MPRASKSTQMTSDAALGSLFALGGRLREARLKRNWTQSLAAEKAGLSESSIKKVEAGAANITISAYLALLDIYGAPTAFDHVMPPGTDTIGDALNRANLRQRASNQTQNNDEWAF